MKTRKIIVFFKNFFSTVVKKNLMNDLFVIFYPITPHLETDLELIQKSIEKNHQIRILMCGHKLKSCLYNFDHKRSRCFICQSRIKAGLKKLGIKKDQLLYLDFSSIETPNLPESFTSAKSLIEYTYEGKNHGLVAASTLIHKINQDPDFDTIENKNLVHISLENVIIFHEFFTNLLNNEYFDQIYFFNGRFSIFRILRDICEEKKITYYSHERSVAPNRYTIRKNTLPHDYKFIWNEIIDIWDNSQEENKIEIGKNWFIRRREGYDENFFSFIKNQDKNLLPKELDSSKRIVSIFNSTMEEYFTVEEFPRNRIYSDELEAVEKICKELSKDPSLVVFIRVHPHLSNVNNLQTKFYHALKKKYSNIHIIDPESPISTYLLIDNSDVIVTFGSTVGIESTFWGKPSITAFITTFDTLDVGYRPSSHEELINLIKNVKEPKSDADCPKYGYWAQRVGKPFDNFVQLGPIKGEFMGEQLHPSFGAIMLAAIFRIFEIRSFNDVKENIQKLKNRIFPSKTEKL